MQFNGMKIISPHSETFIVCAVLILAYCDYFARVETTPEQPENDPMTQKFTPFLVVFEDMSKLGHRYTDNILMDMKMDRIALKQEKRAWRRSKLRPSTVAAERLLRGIRSKCFTLEKVILMENEAESNLYTTIDDKGYLQFYNNGGNLVDDPFRYINLAPDIHSANINLEFVHNMGNDTKSFFEVTKEAEKGKELLLWFSDSVLAAIDMPFLTPINITGHKKYRCHKCNEAFEYPNPLKIHLLLSCQTYTTKTLWQHILKCLTKSGMSDTIVFPYARCISEPPISAFSPYKKPPNWGSHPQPLNLSVGPSIVQQNMSNNILELKMEELSNNYAADVELFASNWGKLKQGHLCVYCGKIYSRKYGLKIHIRTHTGYKPLKCKYCLRPFGDPSNLNKHVRLHSNGLAPYMCSLCGKVLVRRRDLERHLKSQHMNEDGCSVVDVTGASSD